MPTPAPDDQIIRHAATAISYTLLQELYHSTRTPLHQHLNSTTETAVLTQLQSIAYQYLHYDLPFYTTAYYTLEAAKTRAELKPFFRNSKLKPADLLTQFKTTLTQKQADTPPPNSPHHLPRIDRIEASSHRLNQSIKQHLLAPNQLIAQVAKHLHTDSPQTDLPPPQKLAVAQDVLEAVKVAGALNTNPDTAIADTLSAVLANLPQSSLYIRQITSDTQLIQYLHNLYFVTQEALIKFTPTGHLLTINLNHQITAPELTNIFTAATNLQIKPLSVIVARITPKSQLPDLTDSLLNLIYDPLDLKQDLAILSSTPTLRPLSPDNLSTSFARISIPATPSSSTTLAPAPALITTSPFSFPPPPSPKLSSPPIPEAPPSTPPHLVFTAPPRSSAAPKAVQKIPISTRPSAKPDVPPDSYSLSSPNLINTLLSTLTIPFVSASSALQAGIINLSQTRTASPLLVSLVLTILSFIAFIFLATSTNLSSFLQPLQETTTRAGNSINPEICAPSLSPFGSNPYSITDTYRNNGRNCFRDDGGHPGADMGGLPLLYSPFACNATVVYAGWDPGWAFGQFVMLQSGEWTTYYAHMLRTSVSTGDIIAPGSFVGIMDNTGNSYGSHLHYEVRQGPAAAIDNCQFDITVNPCSGFGIQC